MDDLTTALASTVLAARAERGWTVATLAEVSGVSRAMISKVERGEAQATAALLAKLSAALGLTLSELITRAENDTVRLSRAAEQPTWTDPDTGYRRRSVSPTASTRVELVEVELPAGAEVTYPAGAFRSFGQQVWVLHGTLHFTEGEQLHQLEQGDCLQLGQPTVCTFANPGTDSCSYLVVIDKHGAGGQAQHALSRGGSPSVAGSRRP